MNLRSSFPEPHIVPPTAAHTHTVILLHGRGSSGPEFAEQLFEGESFSERTLPQHFPGFRWVFPTAHPSYSTVFGEELVEWFDVYSLTDPSAREELQVDGLAESVALAQDLVKKEVRILGSSANDRVILGGISQGCAVAVTALLTGTCKIAALVGFSGWMPLMGRIQEAVSEITGSHEVSGRQRCERVASALKSSIVLGGEEGRHPLGDAREHATDVLHAGRLLHTPIFLSHSADDEIIEIALGKQMRDVLVRMGLRVATWKEYEKGGHWVPEPEGFEDIVGFLSDVVRDQAEPSTDE